MGRRNPQVASRYAKALSFLCEEAGCDLESAAHELLKVVEMFSLPVVVKSLGSPVVPAAAKHQILEMALDRYVQKASLLRPFCALLVDRGRVQVLPEILQKFEKMIDAKQNRIRVLLKVACEMDEETCSKLKVVLEKAFAKTVILTVEVDPVVLGGFVAQSDSAQIDCSVATKLKLLTQMSV